MDFVEQSLGDLEQFGRIGDVDILGAPDGDGLQALVAHDHAHAPGRTCVIVIHGGHEDPVFAGQADGHHLELLISQFVFQEIPGFRRALPLKMGGVAYFNLVIVDIEIDQIGRLALDDDLVVTCIL